LTGKLCPAFRVKLLQDGGERKRSLPSDLTGKPWVLHFYNSG